MLDTDIDDGVVHVQISVYELTPPGKISTALWMIGCGIYHTAVRIPELGVEYAYAGISPSSTEAVAASNARRRRQLLIKSGVFSLPSPEDGTVVERYMPGCRFVTRIDMGPATCVDVRRRTMSTSNGPDQTADMKDKRSSTTSATSIRSNSSHGPFASDASQANVPLLSSSSESAQSPCSPSDCTRVPPSSTFPPQTYDEFGRLHRPAESMPSRRTQLEQVLACIECMKAESEWRAVRYNLLSQNCNDFTSELVLRLTGKPAPRWINRAAWWGQSLPCLVSEDWIEPPVAEEDIDYDYRSSRRQERDRASSPLLAVAYESTVPVSVAARPK